jgi:hypothetical protein
MPDVFFKIPRSKAKKVIQEALDMAKYVRVEELNCKESFRRRPTKKSVAEVFQMGLDNSNTLWHFCIRYWESNIINISTDIGLSTGPSGITYFLWIDVEHDKAYKLAEKYKLKLIQ